MEFDLDLCVVDLILSYLDSDSFMKVVLQIYVSYQREENRFPAEGLKLSAASAGL